MTPAGRLPNDRCMHTAIDRSPRVVGTTPHAAPEHMLDIQGLRAVAVLLVIADHAGVSWLTGGYVGVDVFFVLSGYLITLLLLREVESRGGVRIGDFYARRARRILPAATLVLVATMAYAAQVASVSQVQRLRDDATWSALFAANIHFAELGTDYFAQGRAPSPFQHYWSLAVEEQFYLVWPALLAIVVLVLRRSRPRGDRTVMSGLLLVVVVASLAWSVWTTSTAPGPAYYSSPGRAWELAIGALLAVQRPRLGALGPRARTWLSSAGVAAIGVSAIAYDAGSLFPGWRALLPVLGTAAVVVAGAGGSTIVNRGLGTWPLVRLGDLSYSLYLWHWPFLVLGPLHPAVPEGRTGTVVLVLLTLVASFLTFHLVENPFRRGGVFRSVRRALVLWPVALGLVLITVDQSEQWATTQLEARLAGNGIPLAEPAPAATATEVERRHGRPDQRSPRPTLAERMADALRAASSADPVPFPLVNLADPTRGSLLGEECRADPAEASTDVCPLGAERARRTMVVLGDSQAGQWLPAIDRLAERSGIRVLPLIKLGCPPFDVPVVDGGGADFWQCTQFREWAHAYIERERPELVVIASEAMSRRLRTAAGLALDTTWARGVESTLRRLTGLDARVVVVADTPDLAFDPVDCLTAPGSRLGDCVGAPHAGLETANALTRRVALDGGAGFVDVLELLCVRGRCPLVVDRTMTFWDYSHVSPMWSAALAGDFETLYRQALRELRQAS